MMIEQTVYIPTCDWTAHICYDVRPNDTRDVIHLLERYGCLERHLYKAENLLRSGTPNQGLTYSDIYGRRSIIAIGHATDVLQFFNSLSHEKQHLEQAICKADNLNPYGEDIAYASGAITEAIARNAWRMARKLFLYLI